MPMRFWQISAMMQRGSRHCATMAPFVRPPKGDRGVGEFLSVERRGKIAILTMNKPESMNAIGTHADCDDIVATLSALGEDRGISAIILTGTGTAFSAGEIGRASGRGRGCECG